MTNAVAEWYEDTGIEVLLIARDCDIAEMYRMKLELDGYRVTRADDVRDVKTPRAGWRPDLVVVDLDGGDTARLLELQRLRSDPVLGDIPLLLLSPDSEEELRHRGLTLRPTDYVLRAPLAGGIGESVEPWPSISSSSSSAARSHTA